MEISMTVNTIEEILPNQYKVVLTEDGGNRTCAFSCSRDDALLIFSGLQHISRQIPDLLDIFIDLMTRNGMTFERTVIDEIAGRRLHAVVFLKQLGQVFSMEVDAPAGVALATRLSQKIFVEHQVLDTLVKARADLIAGTIEESIEDRALKDDLPKN